MTRKSRRRPPGGTSIRADLRDRTGILAASEAGRRVGEPAGAARGGLRHAAVVMGAAATLFFVGWLGTHEPVPVPLETAQAPVQAPPRVAAEPGPVVAPPPAVAPVVAPETRQSQAKPKQATAVVAASETTKKKPEQRQASRGQARDDLPAKTTPPKPKNPVEHFEDEVERVLGPVFDQMITQARGGR